MGAMDTQLMGPSRNRPQRQFAMCLSTFQNRKFRLGRLTLGTYIPQKTGQFPPGDGRIDDTCIPLSPAKSQSMIGFLHLCLLQQGMNMGALGQQYNAEGIPIQSILVTIPGLEPGIFGLKGRRVKPVPLYGHLDQKFFY